MAAKPINLPNTKPGTIIDHLYKLRSERLVIEKQVKDMKAEEARIKDHLINTLPKQELTKLAGKLASCSITRSEVGSISDLPTFQAYVAKKKAYDLYENRLSVTAARERWALGQEIPGVDRYIKLDLSVTKLGGKSD